MPSDSMRGDLEAKGIIIVDTMPSDVAEKGIIIITGTPSELAAKGIIINTISGSSDMGFKYIPPYSSTSSGGTDANKLGNTFGSETTTDYDQFGRIISYQEITEASELIGEILDAGVATEDDWENLIDQLATMQGIDTTDSVVDYLQGVIVLCSIPIERELQSIDAELKILEMWLEIISNEQESSSYDASGRLTSDTTESTVQYRESDFNFISRTLSSIDQQIKALDTGIGVLQEKTDELEAQNKASDYTHFVQLSTQLEELQTTSNILKAKHDTEMSTIRNLRVS
jgi:hypothetical protein